MRGVIIGTTGVSHDEELSYRPVDLPRRFRRIVRIGKIRAASNTIAGTRVVCF